MAAEASKYLFWLGVLLAIIAGLTPFVPSIAQYMGWIVLVEVILGLIIGYMNITSKEVEQFFLGGVAFLVSYPAFTAATSAITVLSSLWQFISIFLGAMATMIAPAVVIVALKVLPQLMKD